MDARLVIFAVLVSLSALVQNGLTQNVDLNAFYGAYNAMCDSSVNSGTREGRVRCILQSVPRQFQPIARQCRSGLDGRVGRQLQDLEFLNQLCYDYNSQVAFSSCAYSTALSRYPFLRVLGGLRRRRRQSNYYQNQNQNHNYDEQPRGFGGGNNNNIAANYVNAMVNRCVSLNP